VAPLVDVSSTSTNSAAVCGRRSASFSKQRITSSANATGVSGRSSLMDCERSAMCAASIFCGDDATNGGRPASNSYAKQPNE
jgi:hypothetical protein